MKGNVNTYNNLSVKKRVERDVKHFKSVMLLNSQKDKQERAKIMEARRRVVLISLLKKGYRTKMTLLNKLNTLKEKKAKLDEILAEKKTVRPEQKLKEVLQQQNHLTKLQSQLRNVIISQRYYRKINSITRNKMDNLKAKTLKPTKSPLSKANRSKSPKLIKDKKNGFLPSLNINTVRVRSVASKPKLKPTDRQTSLSVNIKTQIKENVHKTNHNPANSYSKFNISIQKAETVKKKKPNKKAQSQSNKLAPPKPQTNNLRLPSISNNLRPEGQRKQVSNSKFKLDDLKNEDCLKGMEKSDLKLIYRKLQEMLGKGELRPDKPNIAHSHKRSLFGRENMQSMPIKDTEEEAVSITLTSYSVTEKSESTDSFDDDLAKNPRYKSILNSIILGVDEMKNKVSLPSIKPKNNRSVTFTKIIQTIGDLPDKSSLIAKSDCFYIDNTFVGITWFLDGISISGMIIRTKESNEQEIMTSCLHGQETSNQLVFEVKQYDSLRSVYYYCKEEKLVSMKFVTANHTIFNVGMSFDLIEDLENINCFEINQDMKLAKFSSFFDPASKTIQNMRFEFVKF